MKRDLSKVEVPLLQYLRRQLEERFGESHSITNEMIQDVACSLFLALEK